jgi:proteasome lid subunit RPN8/RPN11
MRAVAVPSALLASLHRFAREAYPEECCGFLLSQESATGDANVRPIIDISPAANRSESERQRRFVILPDEVREAERRAADRSAVVSGFYHSHPDHPARPSAFDQEHAWPWYAYLILSSGPVNSPATVGAFELDPDRREFREIGLTTLDVQEVPPGTAAR